jgi:hypothetical protein
MSMPQTEPTLEELGNNLTQMVQTGKRIELGLLQDGSGSNINPLIEGGTGRRWDYVKELIVRVSGDIAHLDFMGSKEKGGGGIKMTLFADNPQDKSGHHLNLPRVIGDVGPENAWDMLETIEIGGHTYAVPGMKTFLADQSEEFRGKSRSEQPDVLAAWLNNDGILDDLREFVAMLGDIDPADAGLPSDAEIKVILSLYGYGNEDAVKAYRQLEERHPDIFRFLQLAPSTRPREVSNAIFRILGLPMLTN